MRFLRRSLLSLSSSVSASVTKSFSSSIYPSVPVLLYLFATPDLARRPLHNRPGDCRKLEAAVSGISFSVGQSF
jgi:hypothetical protein